MLIYKSNNKLYCYIHIPKNSGKYIRHNIKINLDNTIIKKFWGYDEYFDYAHIPFMMKDNFINFLNGEYINYYTYTRNPYHRIISAFFYKNVDSNINNFKKFIKEKLIKFDFNKNFNKDIIHYYPQYMFICNHDFQINEVKFEKLENNYYEIKEYNLSNFFDEDTIKIINKIYKKDFELFNYEIILKF